MYRESGPRVAGERKGYRLWLGACRDGGLDDEERVYRLGHRGPAKTIIRSVAVAFTPQQSGTKVMHL
jgi:hypothetical protein